MTLALYVPGPTIVHRAPAGLKLLVLTAIGVLVFAVPTLPVAAGTLAGVLLVGLGVAGFVVEPGLGVAGVVDGVADGVGAAMAFLTSARMAS